MSEIIIRNLNDTKIFVAKTCPNILKAIHGELIDWMHSCGGKGRCTTCAMEVVKGKNLLSPLSEVEKFYRDKGRLKTKERLACQCLHAEGTLVILTPERYQFPHIDYKTPS